MIPLELWREYSTVTSQGRAQWQQNWLTPGPVLLRYLKEEKLSLIVCADGELIICWRPTRRRGND